MSDRRSAHESHDVELIARAAAGDLGAAEAAKARDLVAACGQCALLSADLRAIVAATRDLGTAVARPAAAPAPRDFRLTEADAARLRRRGLPGFGRLDIAVGGRGRSVGGALFAFGLVGLLVSAAMPSLFGRPAGAPAGPAEAVSEPAGGLAKESGGAPAQLAPVATVLAPRAAPPDSTRVTDDARDAIAAPAAGPVAVALGSVVLLLAGVALLLASRGGRRSGP